MLVLLASVLGAIYSQPRAFYVGICIFGWGYLLLNKFQIGPTPLLETGGLLAIVLEHI